MCLRLIWTKHSCLIEAMEALFSFEEEAIIKDILSLTVQESKHQISVSASEFLSVHAAGETGSSLSSTHKHSKFSKSIQINTNKLKPRTKTINDSLDLGAKIIAHSIYSAASGVIRPLFGLNRPGWNYLTAFGIEYTRRFLTFSDGVPLKQLTNLESISCKDRYLGCGIGLVDRIQKSP